jgi:hypothetical protein
MASSQETDGALVSAVAWHAKRPRLHPPSSSSSECASTDDRAPGAHREGGGDIIPSIPDKMWALVIDHLPYASVLNMAAVSRSMLRDVMPLVTVLHVDGNPSQLDAGIAISRYRDVRDIYIYTLLKYDRRRRRRQRRRRRRRRDFVLEHPLPWVDEDDEDEGVVVVDGEDDDEEDEDDDDDDDDNDDDDVWDDSISIRVDADTALRAIPFLCHFPRLERAFLGGVRRDGRVEGFVRPECAMDEDRERMTSLIDAFSGAFRSRALSDKLYVLGLRCPRSCAGSNLFSESTCRSCRMACRSFPLDSVIDFECEGSSVSKHRPGGLLYGLDVCLRRDAVEEIIIADRAGGRDMLHSASRFLSLLGRGARHVVVPDEGGELFVVKYSTEEISELRRCIDRSGMDISALSSEAVTDAIRRSFAEDERDPTPPRDRCYLAQNSFDDLRSLGLVIDEASFLNADEWSGEKRDSIHSTQLYSYYNWRFT